MRERYFINSKDNIELYENNLVTLVFESGERVEALEPRRLFPVNRPDEYITLLDEAGKEIGVIRKLSDLNEEALNVINASLRDYYLVPFITEILSANQKSGTLIWTVQTNRGKKRVEIRDRNHDIRVYSDGVVRVRDADDNRYVISDYKKLNKHSQRILMADI